MLPSDLACLDTGNRIMRAVIKLARPCHRHNVPWAIENPDTSFCWMTSLLEELSNVRNVHEMTFDFCAFGIKWGNNATVLAGHVDSADVWALNTTTLFISAHVPPEAKAIRRDWQADLRVCFWAHPHRPNAENML